MDSSKEEAAQKAVQAFYKSRKTGNFVILGALSAFVLGTYAYTILAVSQDDFSDVDSKGNTKAPKSS